MPGGAGQSGGQRARGLHCLGAQEEGRAREEVRHMAAVRLPAYILCLGPTSASAWGVPMPLHLPLPLCCLHLHA